MNFLPSSSERNYTNDDIQEVQETTPLLGGDAKVNNLQFYSAKSQKEKTEGQGSKYLSLPNCPASSPQTNARFTHEKGILDTVLDFTNWIYYEPNFFELGREK